MDAIGRPSFLPFIDIKRDYLAVGNGVADDRAVFAAADAAAVAAGQSIYVDPGTYLIGSNITLSATYQFAPGAIIKPNTGITVTYNGGIIAGGQQTFDVTIGTVTGVIKCDRLDCRWFGMIGDGTTNCKRPFDQAVACAAISQGRELHVPSAGNYYKFTTQPADITSAVTIRGDGHQLTNLLRSYVGSGGIGLLNLRAAGINIIGMAITADTGTNSGSAIALISPSNASYSGLTLEDLYITSLVTDGWGIGIYWDASAKVSAPIGSRVCTWKNVFVFGASQRAVELKTVVDFGWYGGGLFTAQGTSAESLSINGAVGNTSYYVNIDISSIAGDLTLSLCQEVSVRATVIGDIINTSSALDCKVDCTFADSCQHSWVNSTFNGNGFSTVASAAALTIPANVDFVNVTGTTNITSIPCTNKDTGRLVTLLFQGTLTVVDGSNLILASNYVTTTNDTITLRCEGTNWYEVARSVN